MNTGRNANQPEDGFPHNSRGKVRENKNLFPKTENNQNSLDTRRRGRPGITEGERQKIVGRADNLRYVLGEKAGPEKLCLWDEIGEPLRRVKTKEEADELFEGKRYRTYFSPALTGRMIQTIKETGFPKRDREAQIKFMADSIAALGRVSSRRSRTICEEERRKQKGIPWNSDQSISYQPF